MGDASCCSVAGPACEEPDAAELAKQCCVTSCVPVTVRGLRHIREVEVHGVCLIA